MHLQIPSEREGMEREQLLRLGAFSAGEGLAPGSKANSLKNHNGAEICHM